MRNGNLWAVDVDVDGDHWESLWVLAATAAKAESKARRWVAARRKAGEWPSGKTTYSKIVNKGTIDVF